MVINWPSDGNQFNFLKAVAGLFPEISMLPPLCIPLPKVLKKAFGVQYTQGPCDSFSRFIMAVPISKALELKEYYCSYTLHNVTKATLGWEKSRGNKAKWLQTNCRPR